MAEWLIGIAKLGNALCLIIKLDCNYKYTTINWLFIRTWREYEYRRPIRYMLITSHTLLKRLT